MISAGVTLAVLMSLAIAYQTGKFMQRQAYERSVIRRRNSQLGDTLMIEGPSVATAPVKALSLAQLDAMRIKKPAGNPIKLTERAIERQKIIAAAIDGNPEVKWLVKMNGSTS